MKQRRIGNGKGFTLIELMVVMVLLSILTVMGVAGFTTTQKKGRDVRRKGDLSNIAKAIEAFMNDKAGYPGSNASGQMTVCLPNNTSVCAWGTPFKDTKNTYMPVMPKDPTPSRNYYYIGNNGSTPYFQLYAYLENTEDSSAAHDVDGAPCFYSATNCGGGQLCNYGVSSLNYSLDQNHPAVYAGGGACTLAQ